MELVLVENNEREVTLWDGELDSDFAIECLADCCKDVGEMVWKIDHLYGKALALYLGDNEISYDQIKTKEDLVSYLEDLNDD